MALVMTMEKDLTSMANDILPNCAVDMEAGDVNSDQYFEACKNQPPSSDSLKPHVAMSTEADGKRRAMQDCYSYKGWRGKSADDDSAEQDELQQILASGGRNLREVLRRLLESGGDERSVTNPDTGLTKYHTPSVPCKGVHRSSCTSNCPSEEAYGRGIDTLRQLVLEAKNMSRQRGHAIIYASPEDLFRKLLCDVRERLRSIFGLSCEDAISLFPSGTDAELMPSLLAIARALASEGRGSQVFSIVTAAGEVGSGTLQASMGHDFAKRLPSGHRPDGGCIFNTACIGQGPSTGIITGLNLFMRDEFGRLLSPELRDRRVEEVVEEAVAETEGGLPKYGCVLVHMVVGSKTGKCMPSVACLERIVARYGKLILPVVDACQGRMGESDVRRHLDKGRIVLGTGSKFFGGPPFSGVCLMSEALGSELERRLNGDSEVLRMLAQSRLKEYVVAALMSDDLPTLRSMLPQRPLNYGVLMRWTLALYGMEAYYAEVPKAARVRIMQDWTAAVSSMVREGDCSFVRPICDEREAEADEQSVALSTIVSFHCYCNRGTPATAADNMTMDELRHVQLLMASDLSQKHPQLNLLGPARTRCFMGQPVDLSCQGAGRAVCDGMHVLRVAASAPMVVRAWREGLEAVLEEDRAMFEKLRLILGNWFIFQTAAGA